MTNRSFFNPAGDVASHVRAYKSGQVWSVAGSAWVAFNATNWADYKITATSDGDGQFHASIPDDATIAYLCLTGASLAASPQVSYIDLTTATKADVLSAISTIVQASPALMFSASVMQTIFAQRDLPAIAQGATVPIQWTITDGSTPPQPLNLTGKQLRFVLATTKGLNTAAQIVTGKVQYDTSVSGDAGKISLGGTSHNVVTVNVQAADTATPGSYRYFLWNMTDNQPLASGDVLIKPAAKTIAA